MINTQQVFEVENNVLKKYNGIEKDVFIPEGIVEISDYAFKMNLRIEKVFIPNTVKKIQGEAFFECEHLKEVKLSTSITTIENKTFYKCKLLESINIPNGVKVIGTEAFYGCKLLESINIPNGVKVIGSFAFSFCTSLKNVELNTVTVIKNHAFSNCKSLEDLKIPSSVNIIEEEAFSNCSSLKDIQILNENIEIEKDAFKGSKINDLDSNALKIKKGIALSNDGKSALYLTNTSLTKIDIPYGVEKIKKYAFYYNKAITEVFIPNTVVEIGENAFSSLISLKNVEIPDSVKIIRSNAFEYCSSLENVKLSKNITEIDMRTFGSCYKLKSIEIPNSVKKIKGGAFSLCNSLKDVFIPKSVKKIADNAFEFCKIEKFTSDNPLIKNGIRLSKNKKIVLGTFNNSPLKLVIPNGAKKIQEKAFANQLIESVFIPKSVKEIGDFAFDSCSLLKNITFENENIKIGKGAFFRCNIEDFESKNFVIKNGIFIENNTALYQTKGLEHLIFPEGLEKIGDFYGYCHETRHIYIPSTLKKIESMERHFEICVFNGSKEDFEKIIGYEKIKAEKFYYKNDFPEGFFLDEKKMTSIIDKEILKSKKIEEIKATYVEIPLKVFFERNNVKYKFVKVDEEEYKIVVDFFNKNCLFQIDLKKCNNFIELLNEKTFRTIEELNEIFLPCMSDTIKEGYFEYFNRSELLLLNGAKQIGFRAFYDSFYDIDKITILGETIETVCTEAFRHCYVDKIVILNGIKTIEKGAFIYSAIREISIPKTVTTIGKSAFAYCDYLKLINYNGTREDWFKIDIKDTSSTFDKVKVISKWKFNI